MRRDELPMIISVDDHVVEDPHTWTSRLPDKLRDRGPRVERGHGRLVIKNNRAVVERVDDGDACDWWVYEDMQTPLVAATASVGGTATDLDPRTYDQIAPETWRQRDRLKAIQADGVDGSLCFPNLVSRFCGQTFLEAKDKDLALRCVRAYNDWMIEEWCAGDGYGHFFPLTIVPLWDRDLAIAEFTRCADKGVAGVAFSENPYQLGLPSLHSGYWEPFFQTVADAGAVLCLHIGSSSKMPTTSPDAPHMIQTCTHFSVTAGSMLDFIISGTLHRVPGLRLLFAESQAGWIPYLLEQIDWLWQSREGSSLGSDLPQPPSSYVQDRIFTSIYNDEFALRNHEFIGIRQMCFETDFPHSVTSYPNTRDEFVRHCEKAGLDDSQIYELARGTAIRAFGLDRFGVRT